MATGILVLFCVAILNFGISIGELTLKHVIVTYRSPEHTPCDFWEVPKITNISESNSTLTEKGVTRAYDLGRTLGEYYKNNFSLSEWNSSYYYSMGTSAPRCLMSAFNFAAGLENNSSGKVTDWTDKEKQRVQQEKTTFPHTDQYMMFLNKSKCPEFYKELQQELTKTLQTKLKIYSENITDVTRMYSTVNTSQPFTVWLGYEILKTMNESIPKNTTWITNSTWEGLEDYSEQYIYGVESVDNLKKLSGGIMADSILNVTQKIIKGKKPQGQNKEHNHKMSALATSQAPLAAMLGAFTPNGTKYKDADFDAKTFYPRDGAHHVVEIWYQGGESNGASSSDSSSSNYKIRVLYAPGGGNDELSPLRYPDCDGDMCTFEKLKTVLKKVRLRGGDQEQQCKGEDKKAPK